MENQILFMLAAFFIGMLLTSVFFIYFIGKKMNADIQALAEKRAEQILEEREDEALKKEAEALEKGYS